MFLQEKETGVLVEILNTDDLVNPTHNTINGKVQSGQEEQQAQEFPKANLLFPSGEDLPRCWLDADYRN
ncbi:MAG TPA: acetyltransferase [Crinalium sp.]|jgi:hypothetical protein